MLSVKFDNNELGNATYCLEYCKHQSAPDREIELQNLPDRDGEIRLSTHFRSKRIRLKGVLVGTSPSDLQSKVDTFKALFNNDHIVGNLDITPSSGTLRRYEAICAYHYFNQESYNVNYVPWEIEFIVPDGYGYSTSAETIELDGLEGNGDNQKIYDDTQTIVGSRGCLPTITITKQAGTVSAVSIYITNAYNYIYVANNLANPIIIDCDEMTCQSDETDLDFDGIFPDFYTGTDANEIQIYASGVNFTVDVDIAYYPLYL